MRGKQKRHLERANKNKPKPIETIMASAPNQPVDIILFGVGNPTAEFLATRHNGTLGSSDLSWFHFCRLFGQLHKHATTPS
jgi:hypothetical protein